MAESTVVTFCGYALGGRDDALALQNAGLPVLQHVFHADILHDPHGPQQLFPSLCEEVGHAQRVSVRFDLADQPERPEFPQMLQQHFLRDAFNAAFQFRQPHAAVPQLEHDDRFHLPLMMSWTISRGQVQTVRIFMVRPLENMCGFCAVPRG